MPLSFREPLPSRGRCRPLATAAWGVGLCTAAHGQSAEGSGPHTASAETLALCSPAGDGRPWAVTGQAEDGGNTYLLLEREDAGASADGAPVWVLLAEGGCEHWAVNQTGSGSAMRDPSDAAWDALLDESFAWHVTQSSGVASFADGVRAFHGGALVDCPPDAPGSSLPAWLALHFREAGVAVDTPR